MPEPIKSDTPPSSDVKGLLLWIAGRWGGGAIFGVIACVGLSIVYQDMRADREQDLAYRAAETEVNVATAAILRRMATRLESIDRRIDP